MVVDLARSHHGRKAMKYSMVSVVAVACSQAILWSTHALLDWHPIAANVTAVAISAIPSYRLNRAWVWGRTGTHDWWREIVPFWIFAFVGLALSVLFVALASRWSDATLVLSAANLSAFGILWIGRYFFLDQLLFVALEHVHEDADGDESVVPS
jgi:putative flippase GtrA